MDQADLIALVYAGHPKAREVLVDHCRKVADFAKSIALRASETADIDISFVEEAALLHDIGMIKTKAPKIYCSGTEPYICHGVLGAELLRSVGLDRHALVCERHIGIGLSVHDILSQHLPLPLREMRPQNIEEEIIAYADLFFSKTKPQKKTPEEVRRSLSKYGEEKVIIFERWHSQFTSY
ncbi:MAG: HD domain-containing protein [Deltaproteobacteria bacterium]|jgi:uncharacterized protein|nr:HD domain-containing protein [Deltaproteobacteria bacterium]